MLRYFAEDIIFRRQQSLHWNGGFVVLPCKDGFMHVSLFQKWQTLIEWLSTEGMAEDLADEKWLDEDYRRQHLGHVITVLKKWTRTHTIDEIFELAQLMRFPWAPVRSPNTAPSSKHANFSWNRNMPHPAKEKPSDTPVLHTKRAVKSPPASIPPQRPVSIMR
jgi:crotonobetainyl-CoA:carnitine CoA-transferase CaiB-like acyl-CoA transferase